MTDEGVLKPAPLGIPVGSQSQISQPYWEGCRQGELRYQRCTECGTIGLKPTRICGGCRNRSMAWEVSAGLGSLYSWTVVWRPQHPTFEVPYAPAIVTLDEGYYLVSAVIGCRPEELVADMRLQVEFHPATDEVTLPYFRPL